MPRTYWTRGGVIAAIVGVTALLATVGTVIGTGAFEPAEAAGPRPKDENPGDRLEYHFEKTLCGAVDWSVAESVAPLADDVDAAFQKFPENKAVTVECSVLLEGHPESQIYVNLTTFTSVGEAEDSYRAVGEQQRERVDDITKVKGDWRQGYLGTGNEAYGVYADVLVQDSNVAGSVVLGLNDDSVTDAEAQTKAARKVVVKLADALLDVLRRG